MIVFSLFTDRITDRDSIVCTLTYIVPIYICLLGSVKPMALSPLDFSDARNVKINLSILNVPFQASTLMGPDFEGAEIKRRSPNHFFEGAGVKRRSPNHLYGGEEGNY